MSISEYKIVRTGKSDEFVNLINDAIIEGWQPHGSMSIGPRPDGFLFIQPMVKTEE